MGESCNTILEIQMGRSNAPRSALYMCCYLLAVDVEAVGVDFVSLLAAGVLSLVLVVEVLSLSLFVAEVADSL